ncbi:MAG TPA: sucrase ferredoxin [Gaiellaceae bacterium]|nr:sucrase ferredoxin [Gaiellaceae bacterium]
MTASSCAARSLAAGEPLAGTASQAAVLLLLEVRRGWGRDVLDGSPLGRALLDRLRVWTEERRGAKVLFIRRPDRGAGELRAFVVDVAGSPPSVRSLELARHDDLLDLDLDYDGRPLPEPIAVVCGHARRDRCCARLGLPLFDALQGDFDAQALWISSHQGGHRFAPNLLWLPDGLAFGRVAPADARSLVVELRARRLPTGNLRGRIALPAEAQAAEIAAREAFGIEGLTDVHVIAAGRDAVRLSTPRGEIEVRVESQPGPVVPASCGVEPAATAVYAATVVR